MPEFFSPVTDPGTWSYAPAEATVPAGLRYAGYVVRGVRATRAAAASVVAPATGVLRRAAPAGVGVFVEVQINPFPMRRVALALPGGLPTFYLVFDDATGLSFTDGDTAEGGEVLRAATTVTLLIVGQDRVTRDPALWARAIETATTNSGGDAAEWAPFADALDASLNTSPAAPVLLLDHIGQPLRNGAFDVVFGPPGTETVHRASLVPSDGGDLQQAIARLHAADPGAMPIADLWGAATSLRLRPVSANPTSEFQLALLESGTVGVGEITLTPARRHVLLADLHEWFARQCATPTGASQPALQRYTRGNRVAPLVNGPAFFDDLFRVLYTANNSGLGLHLAGWAMFPETEFTARRDGDPADLPLTLRDAAERIAAGTGASRFLPAQFIQLQPAATVRDGEILLFYLITSGILILNDFGVDFARTDAAGALVLAAVYIANAILVTHLFNTGGRFLEPNKDAVDILGALANTGSRFAPYPATVADNPLAPAITHFPWNTLFQAVRHFGIYHQKIAVVRNSGGYVAYCGGIDLNPDRLDDANHLHRSPYHDVHCRIEGPAVRDLAITFEERWARDGGGSPVAIGTPSAASLGTPGGNVVQVARTYFQAADASRRLAFAPEGDRTILDTMLKAITAAREFIYVEDQYLTPPTAYRTALLNKVTSGEIRKLIVVIPGVVDQPFGDIVRTGLINDLRAADAGRGIVHIGYPRRHYTVPDNDLRASSGKCRLMEDLAAASGTMEPIFLGPIDRLPTPPFWVAVEGELIYVYDESTLPNSDPNAMKILVSLRGDDTRLIDGSKGAKPRAHKKGAAATVVELSSIYVHAKMMIVDDVFLSIGSANLNRRGFYSDGEANVFSVPEALKADAANPVAALRRQLWAEMLDLPLDLAAPLLQDPVAAARLFRRSPLGGNRFADIDATPTILMPGGFAGGDGLVSVIIQAAIAVATGIDHANLFDGVVDPSSAVESRTCS